MSNKTKILIVGGVAGGASTAARARRLSEEAEIIMFERGDYISFANCGLPYHIGGEIKDRDRLLVQTPEAMKQRFKIDVRIKNEVTKINRQDKSIEVKNLETGETYHENYDYLILSPGADPVAPPIPGSESNRVLTLRNMADMDAIKKIVDEERPKSAVVIGGGYIGLEMAEAFIRRNVAVTLVELADQVMGTVDPEMASPLHSELAFQGVDLRLGTSVNKFHDDDGKLQVVLSTAETIEAGLAIMAIGVKPDVQLAKDAGLKIGERGGIIVDNQMKTEDPFILAVGDAVEIKDFIGGFSTVIPLAGPANRQGRIAADNIFGRNTVYKDTQGTGICKVFDMTIGMTGANEKTLTRINKKYEKIFIHPASHASYYPGAHPMCLKLIFDPENGKILGAQAVGADGIDKRIDVIAVAIRAGLTVFDLEEQELSYAPPYGSAKDPVNYAGFVASNIMRGDCKICHVNDILNLSENQIVLDVRTAEEAEMGKISGSILIPLDEIRNRLSELDKEKEYLVYCAAGLRGYLACRIITQKGYKCLNLTGGFKTFKAVTSPTPKLESPLKEMKSDTGVAPQPHAKRIVKEIDACAMQCPGPIMKLKAVMNDVEKDDQVKITAVDPGFPPDVKAWCKSTGNELISLKKKNGVIEAIVAKQAPAKQTVKDLSKKKTIVAFSGDFDKAMAAFIIANGAAAMGSEVTMFFTFWGLNILRKDAHVPVKKNLIEKMFGMMMPRGAKKLGLSKMHMMGMGTSMMKGIMKKKNAASLPELIDSAKKAGVQLVACTMSMDMMGIKKEELIDGIEEGGVAMYLSNAEQGNVNLFI